MTTSTTDREAYVAILASGVARMLNHESIQPDERAYLEGWTEDAFDQATDEELERLRVRGKQLSELISARIVRGGESVKINLAVANNVKAPSRNHNLSLVELAQKFSAMPAVEEKVAGIVLHFARFPEHAPKRELENIEAATAIIFDFDGRGIQPETVSRADFEARCRELGKACLTWDTFSAPKDSNGCTFRAALPLAKELRPEQYMAAWHAAAELIGLSPRKALPATQAYFCQARPGHSCAPVVIEGAALDLSDVKSEEVPIKAPAAEQVRFPLTEQQIADAKSALAFLCQKGAHNADESGRWHRIIAALSHYGDVGRKLAHEFSLGGVDNKGKDIYNMANVDKRFEQKARSNINTGIGALFEMAQKEGWKNPAKGRRHVAELPLDEAPAEAPEYKTEELAVDYPPGLVGEVARHIFGASIMPVQSFSIAGGLTVISHLLANRYDIGEMATPLNLYQVLIGKTGHGKEDPRNAIKSLLLATDTLHGAMEEVSSETALLRALAENPNRLMMTDEMGIYLRLALAKNGDTHKQGVIKQMLSLFGLARSSLAPKPYADTSKNIPAIHGPYLNVLGTTTPEQFIGALTNLAIDDGTMNRLLCVTASGVGRKNREPRKVVPPELKSKLASLATPFGKNTDDSGIKIELEAELLFVEFYEKHQTVAGALWARAEEQARRVAGVIASGDGGVVKLAHAQWAIAYVSWCLRNVTREIQHGMAETVFGQRVLMVLKLIREVRSYSGDKAYSRFTKRGLMPHGKLLKLSRLSTRELSDVIEHLCETGEINASMDGQAKVYFVRELTE